jgi:hypothetical protein
MKLIYSISLLFFYSNHFYGQNQVIDYGSKVSIAYARVKLLHQPKGLITSFDGEFKLDSSYRKSDTLLVSCIGYNSLKIEVSLLANNPIVLLSKSSNQLDELLINTQKIKYKKHKIGVVKKPKTQFSDYSVTGDNGYERATLIPNTYSLSGSIQSVNVYITNVGFPNAHFRLHVYECSPYDVTPGRELTVSNIISSAKSGNEWVNIDISNENINLPISGCFVGIEWFDSPDSKYYRDTIYTKGVSYRSGNSVDTIYSAIRKGNGAVLGSIGEKYKYAKNKTWLRSYLDTTWVNRSEQFDYESNFNIPDTIHNGYIRLPNENNTYTRLPCLNLEVLFEKNKIKPTLKAPKKRKLNKIDKVFLDTYKYPQSSLSQLFLSLASSFENDDVVYALKFLCVYNANELDLILEDLYNEKELTEDNRLKIADIIRDIEKQLSSSELIIIDGVNYELKIGTSVYNLILDKGNWKINPYIRTVKLEMIQLLQSP